MSEFKGRKRAWVLTINNPDDERLSQFEDNWESLGLRYGKIALEEGESGTRHFQIYFYFRNAKSFTAVKKLFPTAHIEPRRGTHDEARDYIGMEEKSGKVLAMTEVGIDLNQGGRSDLLTANEAYHCIMEDIKSGATEGELWERYAPYMFRHLGNIRECVKFHREQASQGSVEMLHALEAERLRTSPGYEVRKQESIPFLDDEQMKHSKHFTSPWNLPE